jgi:hypothetical protein
VCKNGCGESKIILDSPKLFMKNVHFEQPTTVTTLNGAPAGSYCTTRYLMKEGDQVCPGTFKFDNSVSVKE